MLILEVLSPRQKEVLLRVMAGDSNAEIGESLDMTEGNVKWHMTNIMKIYDVTTRARLILKVARIKIEDSECFR